MRKDGGLKLWREFFHPDCFVYGLDIDPGVPTFPRDGHIKVLVVDSTDAVEVHRSLRGLTFDMVVDDGKHTLEAN